MRDKIVKFCEDYLKVSDFQDYCHNGLQVEGKKSVKKIITGVSLSAKFLQEAIDKKADMVMVHHGFFGDLFSSPPVIKSYVRDRLKMILENDLNVVGFHLPLDAHSEIGNNISLCKLLDIKKTKKMGLGFVGELKKEMLFEDFVQMLDRKLESKSFIINTNNKVKKVAIVSGVSSSYFLEAAYAGADTFIAGDIKESVVRSVEEVGINFINAGHYNTEKMGIKKLGELVADKFSVDVEFVDIPNDI